MSASIRIVTSKAERREVFRFRYRIYVEEMGRTRQKYADHVARTIEEPQDERGVIWAAWDGTEVVGTLRQNIGDERGFGEYIDEYRMREFGAFFPRCISMNTRLMVAPEHRGGSLYVRLASEAYRLDLRRGIAFDLIDCNAHLVGVFKRLGYRQIFSAYQHPAYGEVTPLVIAIRDAAHLERVRSPFRRFTADVTDILNTGRWIQERERALLLCGNSSARVA